ncbi:MAG: HAD hydrolase family protein, partial [Natronomonas sp.]
GDFGWGSVDTVNRWRETEVAIAREHDREPIDRLADEYGLDVVDTGYAYHVKSATVNKATGLRTIADELGIDTDAFVAVGDSENDAEIFAAAGRSYAVANADDTARSAADFVVDAEFADGFLAAIDLIEAE